MIFNRTAVPVFQREGLRVLSPGQRPGSDADANCSLKGCKIVAGGKRHSAPPPERRFFIFDRQLQPAQRFMSGRPHS